MSRKQIRKRCVRTGHRWDYSMPLPIQFCRRWFCAAERVAPWVPPGPMRTGLQEAIDANMSAEYFGGPIQ